MSHDDLMADITKLDLANLKQVNNVSVELLFTKGKFDILVNNAAVATHFLYRLSME